MMSFNNKICVLFCMTIQIMNVISQEYFRYHNNSEIRDQLVELANQNESESTTLNISLISIGQTKGFINKSCIFHRCQRNPPNELWVIQMTAANVTDDKYIPNVKLIGNVNGYEQVGTEILLQFALFLKQSYNKLPLVTWLLNTTKIHILPSLNPDELEADVKDHVINNNVHFNKIGNSFPSIHYPNNMTDEMRPVETLAIMKWLAQTPFVLSGVLYSGGGKGVTYPYDAPRKKGPHPTPDNNMFETLAKYYVQNNDNMANSTCNSPEYPFKNGILNGAIKGFSGSMGDYNYDFYNCFELSIRLSCRRYPKDTKLRRIWNENKLALLKFLAQAHQGVRGQIIDEDNFAPIYNVTLKIKGRDINFKTVKDTNIFWRLLLPGIYTLQVVYAKGYHAKSMDFVIPLNSNPILVLTVGLRNVSYPIPISKTTIKPTTGISVRRNNSRRIDMRFSHTITGDELSQSNMPYTNRVNNIDINNLVWIFYIILLCLLPNK